MADWAAFKIQIPGKDFLEKIRNILETLLIFLDILKAILETIKAFLIDFGNPLKLLIEALMKLINDLFEALKRTGLYAYYDVPNPLKDPSFKSHFGGFQAFTQRFKGSLLDAQDMQRPQPVKGALKGGFILIVADAEGPMALIALIKVLLSFFGQEFRSPRFLPPANLKVIPVGSKGDPILSVTKIFQNQVQAVAIEWALPSSTPTGDPAFSGLAAHVGQEFNPPSWLIERAEVPPTQEIVIDPKTNDPQLQNPNLAGPVMMNVDSVFADPRKLATTIKRKQHVVDEFGDPVVKFNTAVVLSPSTGLASFLLGQLGTFRYIDENVEYDKVYFYRVRAFSGPLDIDSSTGVIKFKGPLKGNMNRTGALALEWPATGGSHVVVGKSSGVVRVKLAKLPAKFDVMANLRALFLTAFSLNFHEPLPPAEPVLDAKGDPVLDQQKNPTFKPQFDAKGEPLPPLDVTSVGVGSLVDQAGFLIGVSMLPIADSASPANALAASPITGLAPEMPWQSKATRFQAARLSNRFGSLLLNNGTSMIEQFRALMQNPLPKGAVKTKWPEGVPTTLEHLVLYFTRVDLDQGVAGSIASAITEINPTGTVPDDTIKAYGDAFKEETVRRNVLAAITYLKSLGFGGRPPDWIQISILQDLIPWSGQLLYDILAKIQALLDAFNGVFDEIKKFIDLLIRKINTLEDFIRYLVSILDFIASLEVGFFVLAALEVDGDVGDWMATIDNAGGDAPPSGPGGYSGGVGFAYLAADISAFTKAFGLIF
jgi:hypothetical protein